MPSFPSVRTRLLSLAGAGLLAGSLSACSGRSGADAGSTAASSGGDAHTANVTITAAHGCQPDRTQFAAGGITVKVHNADATAVSEVELLSGQRVVGEKENLPPGLSGEFSVTVGAGSYTLYCPGGTPDKTTLTVTGGASSSGDTIWIL